MPIYEYECDKGHRFEKMQSFSEPPVKRCPRCNAKAERLLSPPAVIFKGEGWYITDSRKKREKAEGKGDTKSKEKGENKADEVAA